MAKVDAQATSSAAAAGTSATSFRAPFAQPTQQSLSLLLLLLLLVPVPVPRNRVGAEPPLVRHMVAPATN